MPGFFLLQVESLTLNFHLKNPIRKSYLQGLKP